MSDAVKITIDTKIADQLAREFRMLGRTKYVIHDGVPYGVYVELGTSRMPARPCLIPAFDRHTRKLPDILRAAADSGVPFDVVLRKMAWDIAGEWAANVPRKTGTYANSITVSEEAM